jgi:large subunit ribosomal protein L1
VLNHALNLINEEIIMPKRSKRYKEAITKINKNQSYTTDEAIKHLKEMAKTKFDESIEVHCNLGIDPKKGDQLVRGSVFLPHGTGQTKRIVAFVTADKEKQAKEAGADLIGGKELIEQIKNTNKTAFDIAVAEPAMMKDLAAIARILGQKGLMPNPKSGTVTTDIKKTIAELKKGKINYKNDDTGNVHVMIGKMSFDSQQLKENFSSFMDSLKKAKPDTIKGTYLKSVVITSTMGPGVKVII